MSDPFFNIVMSAAELKRAAPDNWDRFANSIAAYCTKTMFDYLAAGRDNLEQAQGRAQALVELSRKLEDCFNLERQYRERK